MTKKTKVVLIAVLALIACVCLFAGCTLKPSLKDVLDDFNQQGIVVDVTYFANEGNFNGSTGSGTQNKEEETYPNEENDGHEHTYRDGACVYCGKYQNERDDGHEHTYKDGMCIYCGKEQNESNKHKVRTLRYSAGSKAINIGKTSFESGGITVTSADITRYELAGWYKAELDANGNPVYEDGSSYTFDYDTNGFDINKRIKYNEDEPFDFSTSLEKGTHYYLVAVWRKIQTVHVVLAGEVSSVDVTLNDGTVKTVKKGEEIRELAYQTDGQIPYPTALESELASTQGTTFVEFYTASTCEKNELFEGWPIKYSEHDGDYTLYAKYISGEWTIVKDVSSVRSMFSGAKSESNHYYVIKDIDCNNNVTVTANASSQPTNLVGFGCEIVGNGCTISRFKVTGTLSGNIRRASLFGDIKETAKISNIIFKDVTQEYTVNDKANVNDGIYFAFASIAEGAKVEGVEITGTCSMKVTFKGNEAYVNNLVGDADDHWKFGGNYSDGKDSDYSGGITVTDSATLTIIHEN